MNADADPPSLRARRRRTTRAAKAAVLGLTLAIGWLLPRGAPVVSAQSAPGEDGSRPLRADALPPLLSATGLFADLASLRPAADLLPYEINLPFWSDGAAKSRWIRLPVGTRMEARGDDGAWQLPPGTTLVKHFEIDLGAATPGTRRRLETRVLVVGADGTVDGGTYRWRADGRDADLVTVGSIETFADAASSAQSWQFMAAADCRTCHTPQAGGVLGINTPQLDRDVRRSDGPAQNQIATWRERGLLAAAPDARVAPLPSIDDAAVPVETRARAWLAVNCAQCHRPGGAPTEFDLRLATPLDRQGLVDGRPRINLGVDGARLIAPNDPWRSLILHRVETLDGNRMPPLAHGRVDERGAALLREWIASLPGPPVLAPPMIAAAGDAARLPVTVALRHPDASATIRYTLDGSAPTTSSPAYAGPIHLERPATLRARAFRDGHTRSVVVQQTFAG